MRRKKEKKLVVVTQLAHYTKQRKFINIFFTLNFFGTLKNHKILLKFIYVLQERDIYVILIQIIFSSYLLNKKQKNSCKYTVFAVCCVYNYKNINSHSRLSFSHTRKCKELIFLSKHLSTSHVR